VVPKPPTGLRGVSAATRRSSGMLISRVNRHLITMLLVQVCLTMFLNLPYVIFYLNNLYHTVKLTPLYLTVIYITTWFWFLNYCKTFYVNTLSSQLFRSILKQQLLYLLYKSRIQLVIAWPTSEHQRT
jgi:hypothetical protein